MYQGSSRPDGGLPKSLQPLAQIAGRYVGAEGYAIYEINPKNGLRELRCSEGASALGSSGSAAVADCYPLRVDDSVSGLLMFVFPGRAAANDASRVLERIARTIESVWRSSLIPSAYAHRAAYAGQLEAELADAKIADRARGILSNATISEGAVDTILRHVENVLRPGQLEMALMQMTSELEQQVTERALATRAKEVLQARYGMSEDQAHAHLRSVSRKSRRRVIEVARDLLEETRP